MTTLLAPARTAKSTRNRLHPMAPAKQSPRPFGQGILPQTRAERIAASSAWLAARQVEHATEARVAGVTDADLDRQYWLGHQLGCEGIEAVADQDLTFLERKSFRDGHEAGTAEMCEGLALAALDRSGLDLDAIDDAELAEARMTRESVYCLN